MICLIGLFYTSNQDPRVAVLITSDVPSLAEDVCQRLSKHIGSTANKATVRDAAAARWEPIITSQHPGTQIRWKGQVLSVGARVNLDYANREAHVSFDQAPPPYLLDLLQAQSNAAFFKQETGRAIAFRVDQSGSAHSPKLSLNEHLVWLLTVVVASVGGAMAAASTYALTTAFLESPRGSSVDPAYAREDFLGKLIGIGGAYATLGIPWSILIVCALFAMALLGDAAVVEAIQTVTISALRADRILLFLLCAPAGYALFASVALMIASSAKSAASARSITGPLTFIAIAPAPCALAFSQKMEGVVFTALNWFPFTAQASIQLGIGTLNTFDLYIHALFLCFTAMAVIQYGMNRHFKNLRNPNERSSERKLFQNSTIFPNH